MKPEDVELVTTETLVAELDKRGFDVFHRSRSPWPERKLLVENEEPVEKWLGVWEKLQNAIQGQTYAIDVADAVEQLYLLLEPPSVREARQKL